MPAAKKTPLLREDLRKELPRLLREDPELRGQIIGLLSEYLTTREETAAILVELRQMRADFDRRMDEQGQRIEEQGRILGDHTRQLGSLERTLGAIGARWGMMSEEAFRNAIRALFAEQPEARVESWRYQDREGKVFGRPLEVELDAIVRDGMHLVVEIKSSVSVADVAIFARKAELYAEVTGRHVQRRLIVSPFVDRRAVEMAERLGIEVHAAVTPPAI